MVPRFPYFPFNFSQVGWANYADVLQAQLRFMAVHGLSPTTQGQFQVGSLQVGTPI